MDNQLTIEIIYKDYTKQSVFVDSEEQAQQILDKLKIIIPFSYMWILRCCIGNAKTILDLGCGDGSLMVVLSQGKKWKILGIDIFPGYIKIAKKRKIYHKLVLENINQAIKKLIKRREKFDVVFFSQVIEHISKQEGEKILDSLDKLAKKRIIVGTPRGYMNQPENFLDANPHQVHKSGWLDQDFMQRGYKIYGVGIKQIWAEEGLARTRNKLAFIIWTIIAYFLSVPVYFLPKLGAGIIAIKKIERRN